MTTSPTIASPYALGSNPATGRNIYVEGNRYVARFRVTLATAHAGTGDAFDPEKYGFPYLAAEVGLILRVSGRRTFSTIDRHALPSRRFDPDSGTQRTRAVDAEAPCRRAIRASQAHEGL